MMNKKCINRLRITILVKMIETLLKNLSHQNIIFNPLNKEIINSHGVS